MSEKTGRLELAAGSSNLLSDEARAAAAERIRKLDEGGLIDLIRRWERFLMADPCPPYTVRLKHRGGSQEECEILIKRSDGQDQVVFSAYRLSESWNSVLFVSRATIDLDSFRQAVERREMWEQKKREADEWERRQSQYSAFGLEPEESEETR